MQRLHPFRLKHTVSTALACVTVAVVVTVAGGWTQPAQAGISGLSYQEVTRLMFGQQTTPAPGVYFTGSFAGDYQQAASSAQPRQPGLFGSLKWAMGALNSLKNGYADTQYYWNGMKREDKPDQTATIEIPAKNERIELNFAAKTYAIVDETPQAPGPAGSMEPMPQMPTGSAPPQKPGTAIVYVTTTTTDLGRKVLDNVPAEGFKITSSIRWTDATGSCKDDSFSAGGEMVEFISKYQQPTVAARPMPKVTMPASMPTMPALPSLQSLQQAMATGCKPTIKANIQRGVHIPVGMSVWQYFGAQANMQDQSQQQQGQEQMQELNQLSGGNGNGGSGFGSVIERGSFRVLGPADAALFQVPPGFKQVAAPKN